jgi:beta-fructofuranosidase
MSLRYDDRWIWDFWTAIDGPDVHLFHLQAPRALGDPERRHHHATVGHAVSRDLRTWTELPTALEAGPPGAFDDLATWTGSVMRHGRRWHMLYSGISRAEDGAVQRIGRATSDDLVHWERHGAVLEADPRWYETRGPDAPEAEEHWRDPWVFQDPATGRFHALLCARAATGPPDGRGVIGHAWSDDLATWEAGPPLSAPGELRQLEVPQLVRLGGAWRVLFCATEGDHSAARLARPGVRREGGSHVLSGPSRLGPFALEEDAFLLGPGHGSWYAARIVEHGGARQLLAWRRAHEDGRFAGEIGDPMALEVGPGGVLSVAATPDAGRV